MAEVCDIVHETGIKTISKKKKCKKPKWLSEEALQIAEKKRELRNKGERERYTHLNAEFQRIARRDKKHFLSDQCKEIEDTTEWERLGISSRKSGRRGCSVPLLLRASSWVRKILWRKKWPLTPLFLPGESHGQRYLMCHILWSHKELDITEAI